MANLTAKVTEQQFAAGSLLGNLLGEFSFTPGWVTFGLGAPQGAVQSGLGVIVGNLTTQTDIKVTWPDGSMKHGIITSLISSAGSYSIKVNAIPSGSVAPIWPSASVSFLIGGVTYIAVLPSESSSSDVWLSGNRCIDKRILVTPVAGALSHPTLQVIFDIRSFTDGNHRVDICVQNCRDVAEMNRLDYNVTIQVAGNTVFTRSAVVQPSFTRWRKVFWVGATESIPTYDFTPYYQSGLFHKFWSGGLPETFNTTASKDVYGQAPGFDILGFGLLNPSQPQASARPDLGIHTAWSVVYLLHQNASSRECVLRHGEYATSWSSALYDTDGKSLIKWTDNSEYYWSTIQSAPNRPKCPTYTSTITGTTDFRGTENLIYDGYAYRMDAEHIPNIAYLPYVITGDRFYLDQTKLWANAMCLKFRDSNEIRDGVSFDGNRLGHFVPALYWFGGGACRGTAWPWREVFQAAAITPNSDSDRIYFNTIVDSIQWWADYYEDTANKSNAMQAYMWDGDFTSHSGALIFGAWHMHFMALVVDLAERLGFTLSTGLTALRYRAMYAWVQLLTSTLPVGRAIQDADRFANYPKIGDRIGNDPVFFTTIADFWNGNQNAWENGSYTGFRDGGVSPTPNYRGPNAWHMSRMAEKHGLPGGTAARAFVDSFIHPITGLSVIDQWKSSSSYYNFMIDVDG